MMLKITDIENHSALCSASNWKKHCMADGKGDSGKLSARCSRQDTYRHPILSGSRFPPSPYPAPMRRPPRLCSRSFGYALSACLCSAFLPPPTKHTLCSGSFVEKRGSRVLTSLTLPEPLSSTVPWKLLQYMLVNPLNLFLQQLRALLWLVFSPNLAL